jgi:protein-S-isoprenylcysteine O-methyltransferase Ste14
MARLRAAARAIVVAAAALLIAARFLVIDSTSHSNSDTLRPWIIQGTLIVLVAYGLILLINRFGRPPRSE